VKKHHLPTTILTKADYPPIVLTSEVNLLSLQKDCCDWEFFRNTASGTRITTKSVAGYKAIQNLLRQRGLPFLTFYTKGDKMVKAVIRHVPNNTSSEDIIVALQELGYEVISVKQMTKPPSPKGGVTHLSLPLLLITLVRNQKSLDVFKISSLCNIIVKVEAYQSKGGLTQCYNWPHLGPLQSASSLLVVRGWSQPPRMSGEHPEYPKLLQL
jgi:hypothetical protein